MRRLLLLSSAFLVLACGLAFGQAQTLILHSFSGDDGLVPVDKLLFDSAGSLYGTASYGGEYQYGTIFELSPNNDGTWSEATLYNFCTDANQYGVCLDGAAPTAGLVADNAGNLYGVTTQGGDTYCPNTTQGCGVAFELSPPSQAGGAWSYKVIYNFCTDNPSGHQCADGVAPPAPLVFDKAGNLYGASLGNTVFELSPGANGWTEDTLYNFCATGYPICPDGDYPHSALTFDSDGDLYGTTERGGSTKYPGDGVIYKLTPGATGWSETVIASFLGGKRGGGPEGAVNFDAEGNIYSTTFGGGTQGVGGVFRLSAANRSETFVSFVEAQGNIGPTAGVLIEPKTGNLYGTTSGDIDEEPGTVYRVSRNGTVTVLASGGNPEGALIADKHGNLYGTYSTGGQYGLGAVFEIIP